MKLPIATSSIPRRAAFQMSLCVNAFGIVPSGVRCRAKMWIRHPNPFLRIRGILIPQIAFGEDCANCRSRLVANSGGRRLEEFHCDEFPVPRDS